MRRKRVGFKETTAPPSSKIPLLAAPWQQPTVQHRCHGDLGGRRVWRAQAGLPHCQLGAACGQRITPTCSLDPQRRIRAPPPVFDNLTSWRRHMISCDASAEQHGETALGKVYVGDLPGRSVGFRSVDYKK